MPIFLIVMRDHHIQCETVNQRSCEEGANNFVLCIVVLRTDGVLEDFSAAARDEGVQSTGLPFCRVIWQAITVSDAFCDASIAVISMSGSN